MARLLWSYVHRILISAFTHRFVPTWVNDNIVAGADTTRILTTAMMYHLLKNPSSLSTLRKEIDNAVAKGRISQYVTWKESQTLPYLEACVNEATRMYPPFGLPFEQVVPEAGLYIDGYFIPGGTRIGIVRNRSVLILSHPYSLGPFLINTVAYSYRTRGLCNATSHFTGKMPKPGDLSAGFATKTGRRRCKILCLRYVLQAPSPVTKPWYEVSHARWVYLVWSRSSQLHRQAACLLRDLQAYSLALAAVRCKWTLDALVAGYDLTHDTRLL